MAKAEFSAIASRALPPNCTGGKPDSHVALLFDDGGSGRGETARLTIDHTSVCEGSRSDMYGVLTRLIGKPARLWSQVAASAGVRFTPPENMGSIEQNLAKATFLTAIWLEPDVVSSQPASHTGQLVDTMIVDYSGAPGTQRYIYFPPQDLDEPEVDRLYHLRLLCRLKIAINGNIAERYFVPLVTPGVAAYAFDLGKGDGGKMYQVWQEVRRSMGRCVQRTLGSRR